jgi:hypothetical protein
MDVITLGLAKKYTSDTADGLGAVKGAPCTVKSVEETATGKIITLEWTGNSGAKETTTVELANGAKGEKGESVSVVVNGTKYEPVNGVITLPDYSTGGGGTQSFKYSSEKPTKNATTGEIVFNSSPQPNGFVGWVYTAFGWLGFGTIENTQSVVVNAFTLSDMTHFLVKDENGSGTPFLYKI